jgi:hypothetical protein
MTHVYEGFKDNLINLTKIINKYGIKVEDWGKNIFTDSHRQAVFRNQHLPLDISGNEAFWRLRSIDDQTSEKIRDLAKWASEVLGVPEIHNDIEKMAAAGDLMTSELGMDQSHQALTFNIPNRSPFILINTNRLPRAGKKNLSHLTPSDLQNRRHYEYIQRASAAALLAHEWTHTKQNYQYVFEHTDAQVEASAYKVERLFIEKLLELPENRDPKLQLKLKTLIEYDIEGTYLESYGTPLRASKKR